MDGTPRFPIGTTAVVHLLLVVADLPDLHRKVDQVTEAAVKFCS